jgi:hypothetical protein
MANGKTAKAVIRTTFNGNYMAIDCTPYLVSYDTANADLTIATPSATSRLYLVGQNLVNTLATKVIYKSGSTIIASPDYAANSGWVEPLVPTNVRVLLHTEPGQPLVINANAVLNPFYMYVIEAA